MATNKNVIIGISVFLAVVLLLVIGSLEQQIVSGSSFNNVKYKILSETRDEIIVEMRLTADRPIFDSGCNGQRGYSLPSNFNSQGFQHSNEARYVEDLVSGFHPITSLEVNNDVRVVYSDCGGDTQSLRPELNLNGGECKVVMYEGGLAMDCRKINAQLTGFIDGNPVPATLKSLDTMVIKVTIPKIQEIPEVIDPQLIDAPLIAEPEVEETEIINLEESEIIESEIVETPTEEVTGSLDTDEKILIGTFIAIIVLLIGIVIIWIRRRS